MPGYQNHFNILKTKESGKVWTTSSGDLEQEMNLSGIMPPSSGGQKLRPSSRLEGSQSLARPPQKQTC